MTRHLNQHNLQKAMTMSITKLRHKALNVFAKTVQRPSFFLITTTMIKKIQAFSAETTVSTAPPPPLPLPQQQQL